MIKQLALCTLMLTSTAAMAAPPSGNTARGPLLNKSQFYIGAGIAHNSVGGPVDDEVGYQFFMGYDLSRVDLMQGVNTAIELGYMDYGFSGSNSGGLWVNGVVDGSIQGNFGWLARLGFDMGDDDGLMVGAGLSYKFNSVTSLRGEYVVRDHIDSLQANLVYHF